MDFGGTFAIQIQKKIQEISKSKQTDRNIKNCVVEKIKIGLTDGSDNAP